MTIGDRIKLLRKSKQLSQENLAELLNTTKQAIYKYENNLVTNIPMDKIEILSNVFCVSPAYLMGWEDFEVTPSPDLSDAEAALLELFRAVPPEHQQMLLGMIEGAINNLIPPK